MIHNARKWQILTMVYVGIFSQFMIEGVQASSVAESTKWYEIFGENSCETVGSHFDLNSNIDKMVRTK